MKYYKDVISKLDPDHHSDYFYHIWTSESVERFWTTFSKSPILRRQFLPVSFWQDLLDWATAIARMDPASILDLGCGSGAMICCLSRQFPRAHLIGVDVSRESIEKARADVRQADRVEFRVGALPHLPLENEAVDLVICTEVLEHLEPETFEAAFAEIARVLRPGGFFLASLPFNQPMEMMVCPQCVAIFTPNQHLLFEISREDIEARLEAKGFRMVASYEPINHRLPPQWHRAVMKRALMKFFPGLARRLLFKAGVSGLLAQRS